MPPTTTRVRPCRTPAGVIRSDGGRRRSTPMIGRVHRGEKPAAPVYEPAPAGRERGAGDSDRWPERYFHKVRGLASAPATCRPGAAPTWIIARDVSPLTIEETLRDRLIKRRARRQFSSVLLALDEVSRLGRAAASTCGDGPGHENDHTARWGEAGDERIAAPGR